MHRKTYYIQHTPSLWQYTDVLNIFVTTRHVKVVSIGHSDALYVLFSTVKNIPFILTHFIFNEASSHPNPTIQPYIQHWSLFTKMVLATFKQTETINNDVSSLSWGYGRNILHCAENNWIMLQNDQLRLLFSSLSRFKEVICFYNLTLIVFLGNALCVFYAR